MDAFCIDPLIKLWSNYCVYLGTTFEKLRRIEHEYIYYYTNIYLLLYQYLFIFSYLLALLFIADCIYGRHVNVLSLSSWTSPSIMLQQQQHSPYYTTSIIPTTLSPFISSKSNSQQMFVIAQTPNNPQNIHVDNKSVLRCDLNAGQSNDRSTQCSASLQQANDVCYQIDASTSVARSEKKINVIKETFGK